jgi:hypothetical protein
VKDPEGYAARQAQQMGVWKGRLCSAADDAIRVRPAGLRAAVEFEKMLPRDVDAAAAAGGVEGGGQLFRLQQCDLDYRCVQGKELQRLYGGFKCLKVWGVAGDRQLLLVVLQEEANCCGCSSAVWTVCWIKARTCRGVVAKVLSCVPADRVLKADSGTLVVWRLDAAINMLHVWITA